MNTSKSIVVAATSCAFVLALASSGCRPTADEFAAVSGGLIVGPEYSASKGLYVPEETRKSLGLRIVDATEENIGGMLEASLCVYEVRDGRAHASGVIAAQKGRAFKPGQLLDVHTSSGTVVGRVSRLSEDTTKRSGSIELLVEFEKPEALQAGAFVTVSAKGDAEQPVTAIPESAVIRGTEGPFVYTVSGEHFVRTPVELGATANDRVAVTDGLYSGDQVVAEPAMSLWLIELAAVKGGHACCVLPPKGK